MLPTSENIVKTLAWNCCIVLVLLLVCPQDSCIFAEARRRNTSRTHRLRNGQNKVRGLGQVQNNFQYRKSHTDILNTKQKDHFLSQKAQPTVDAKTERIRQAILTLPELSKLLDPLRRASDVNVISPADNFHLTGTVRRRRLYCRVGRGFHLEIRPNGRVVGRHQPTKDGVLEIFSVKMGVVGVRGVLSHRYLCMNKKGKLFSSSGFSHECEFRERIEDNYFNTYASNTYSDHETRSGYYMSLTKKGKSKRSKTVSGRQQKAHWLPRSVND